MSMVDFQSFAGPGDKGLPSDEVRGYQPVSRIGEIVTNAFVDSYEFSQLAEQVKYSQMNGSMSNTAGEPVEFKPHFHEWATVAPGMVCLSRKKRTAVFRQFVAAETAAPVIACAACQTKDDERNFFFAGVARSKSVRTIDDGLGPTTDEFFTLSIGGMSTVLNTSGEPVHPGDLIEWTFLGSASSDRKRAKPGPRRVGIKVASVSSPKVFGRALSFAKNGEPLDLLLKQ